MRFLKILAMLPLLTLPAAAQDAPQLVTITLSDYSFTPGALVLVVGKPVQLHLVNGAGKGHSFSAPEFFAAANMAPDDKARVKNGAIELKSGESADLTVTPAAAGTYQVTCSHFMHAMMGMKGSITVQ